MKVIQHDSLANDWCHLCGKRKHPTADIWFPENAEHERKNTRYVRICSNCAEKIGRVALGTIPPDDHPTKGEVWGSTPARYEPQR